MRERIIRSINHQAGGGWNVGDCLNLSDIGTDRPFRPVERITLEKDVPTAYGMGWRVVVWDADGPALEVPYLSLGSLVWEELR